MASKINDLSAATSPLSTDITNIVNSPFAPGDDKKITMANFLNLVNVMGFTASGITASTSAGSAGIAFDITPAFDTLDHTWSFNIFGQQFLKMTAAGDNNLGIEDAELDLYGNVNITTDTLQILKTDEPPAITIALAATPGVVPNGTYKYAIVFVTASGNTSLIGPDSNSIQILNNAQFGQIAVDLPISSNPAVVQRDIYRNDGGGYKLVTSILNNSDLQYLDNNASASGNPPSKNTTGNLEVGGNILVDEGRIEGQYVLTEIVSIPSDTVASTNDLPLGRERTVITGSVQINAIVNAVTGTPGGKTLWSSGDVVTLIFSGNPTIKNNTAGAAGTSKIMLAGGQDFPMSGNVFGNGTIVTLYYDGTQWQEITRSVNHA